MRHLLKQFAQREAHPVVQFLKYSIAGGVATAVDVLIFYVLSWKVLPALQADDGLVRLLRDWCGLDLAILPVAEAVRARHFVINRVITYFFSNLTAYFINFYWVFTPGRHRRHVEVLLFYAVSLTSLAVGTTLGWAMIHFFGLSTTTSYLGNLVASLAINYVCRKYLVFKG
jgi:putative flippase GtrA